MAIVVEVLVTGVAAQLVSNSFGTLGLHVACCSDVGASGGRHRAAGDVCLSDGRDAAVLSSAVRGADAQAAASGGGRGVSGGDDRQSEQSRPGRFAGHLTPYGADVDVLEVVNFTIPQAIAKCALLAPVFIPLFIRLGIARKPPSPPIASAAPPPTSSAR